MTNYVVTEGDYSDALADLMEKGGQFFPAKTPEGSSTILRGNTCIVYWPKNSPLRSKVREACEIFGYDAETMTASRLCKSVLKDFVCLDSENTFWGNKARSMAKSGSHWHYQHVIPGYHHYLIEFDVKSAYFSSLFSGKSLLFDEKKGWLEDYGALNNLKSLSKIMPKWMRLIMLGVIASHKMQYYVIDKSCDSGGRLLLRERENIVYGAAFNAAHKAIKRTYELMKRIHSVGGDYVKRIHTDSFAITPDLPVEIESEIFGLLERNGYQYSMKGCGTSHFIDLNTGIIGRKLIGNKNDVFSEFRDKEIKIEKYELTPEELARWSEKVHEHELLDQLPEMLGMKQSEEVEIEQMSLLI